MRLQRVGEAGWGGAALARRYSAYLQDSWKLSSFSMASWIMFLSSFL